MNFSTSRTKDVTIPLLLVVAGIVLSYLLPSSETVEKTLLSFLKHKSLVLVVRALIVVIVTLLPYWAYQKFIEKKNIDTEKVHGIFNAAIHIIQKTGYQGNITLEQIQSFKSTYELNKIFLQKETIKLIDELLSDLYDLETFSTEREGDISGSERSALVAKERKTKNKIEASKSIFDKHFRHLLR